MALNRLRQTNIVCLKMEKKKKKRSICKQKQKKNKLGSTGKIFIKLNYI